MQVSTSEEAGGKKRIAIFVEPSPFSHVSGMKIRFSNLIKGLRELGDDVMVFTPCVSPPKTFHGAKVHSSGLSVVPKRAELAIHASQLKLVIRPSGSLLRDERPDASSLQSVHH